MYSGSGSPRSPPTMRSSSAIERIPFSTNLSHLSLELGKSDSPASSPCRSEPSRAPYSIREQEQQKKVLEEENFKLKLRVYMLEERLQRQDMPEKSNKFMAELKVQAASLRDELEQKKALLQRASDTLEALEQQYSEETERHRETETERALLERTLEEFEEQYREEVEHHEEAEEQRQRLQEALDSLEQRHREEVQRHKQTETQKRRLETALRGLQQRHAEEVKQHEQTEAARQRLEASLKSLEQCHSEGIQRQRQAEADVRRVEECLKSREEQYMQEIQRREQAEAENSRLGEVVASLRSEKQLRAGVREKQETAHELEEILKCSVQRTVAEKPVSMTTFQWPVRDITCQTSEKLTPPASKDPDRSPSSSDKAKMQPVPERDSRVQQLQRQLVAAAAERRRAQAVAAAALQLQTERARSLQASVQALSAQVRRTQAELAQCRTERDRLREQAGPTSAEPVHSSTEGVEIIQELGIAPQHGAMQEHLAGDFENPLPEASGQVCPLRGSVPTKFEDGRIKHSTPKQGTNQPQEGAVPVRSVPAGPGDNSDWEAWSEPDRDVSLARIGLERSSLEPPAEAWRRAEATTDIEGRTGRRSQRQTASEVRELEERIEGLQQVRDALRAEVGIYQKMLPSSGEANKRQPGVTVPPQLLAEIQRLQQRLVSAVSACGRSSRQQHTADRDHGWAAPPELTLALSITQEELAESTQKLSAVQQKNQKLKAKLQQVKDRMRLTQLEKDELQDQYDAVSEEVRSLKERFDQMEAERNSLTETLGRATEDRSEHELRRLRHQLDQSSTRQHELELLVRQLTEQLRQVPAAVGGVGGDGEERIRRAETQLLALGRERLRLLSESARLRSRCRLLRTEADVRDGRLSACEAPADWRADRARLLQQLEQARLAEARLEQQHGGCEQRLRELGRALAADRQRAAELSQQLDKAHVEMQLMQSKAGEYDEAGHSCPESTRSCELPAVPASPGGVRQSSHSESDPHDEFLKSGRPPAYSSPDLGIESDCHRCSSRTSSTVQSQRTDTERTPLPSAGEAAAPDDTPAEARLAAAQDALQHTLGRLERAERCKADFQSAVFRQLGRTHQLVARARGCLTRGSRP